MLEDARRLEREGRLDAADRTTKRGLEVAPDDVRLLRLRADVLDALGRGEAAAAHRARAEALAPAPTSLPAVPLARRDGDESGAPAGTGIAIVLLAPPDDARRAGRAVAIWPGGPIHAVLVDRLGVRLPAAHVLESPASDSPSLDEPTIATLRDWVAERGAAFTMSLRVDRAHCSDTVKDGRFGRAVVRVGLPTGPEYVEWTADDVAIDEACPARQVAHAIEAVLTLPAIRHAVSAGSGRPTARPTRGAVRALFPDVEQRVDAQIRSGRRHLATGRLDAARTSFQRATEIDPEHLDARSFLAEVELTLALSEQLESAQAAGPDDVVAQAEAAPGHTLGPRLLAAEERALEQQLAAERRRREDLLATLELLQGDRVVPGAAQVAQLRPGTLPPPGAKGPRRARAQLAMMAGLDEPSDTTPLDTRVLHAPNGELIARYYFSRGANAPVLVEQDTSGDGRPDRWVAWVDGQRQAVWEESRGGELPDVHIVYGDGGRVVERIELTPPDRATPERVFVYRDGRLRSDFRDTEGDGRFDEIQHFDIEGSLTLRESDLNGDGVIDVRTAYRNDRMIRREIMNPEVEGTQP